MSQRQVSATSRSVCTTCKTSPCDRTPVRCTRSDLVWGGMWTSCLIQCGGPYDALSLVHLHFVPATCWRKCTYGATTLLWLILSLQSNWFEFVQLIAATKFCLRDNDFHKINRVTGGELLRQLVPATVAATYRLVCPGLSEQKQKLCTPCRYVLHLCTFLYYSRSDNKDFKQGSRLPWRERCLKILFSVTVIISRLLQVARLGKCEHTSQA